MAAHPEVLAYLIEGAKRRGIDPAVVVKAFGHEGLNVFDPNKPDRGGDEGSSFGPYQLHYKGMSKSMPNAGMGDDFTRDTGLDARDPSTWRQQTDYVLDYLAKGGTWKPWMGAAAEGIYGRTGLPGGTAARTPSPGAPAQPDMPRPNATSPQMATDMASPGNPAMSTPRPTGQVQGPPNPPGWTPPPLPGTAMASATPAASDLDPATGLPKKGWRNALARAASGFKMPDVAKNDTALTAMAMPAAARVDTPEVPNFDPNQIAQQRQNLAMAMQRLNSGKIWL